jgi:hypothetical protein
VRLLYLMTCLATVDFTHRHANLSVLLDDERSAPVAEGDIRKREKKKKRKIRPAPVGVSITEVWGHGVLIFDK